MFEDAEIIIVYTRKQAIEDGVLIDASKMAKVAGFKWPVAVTATVWAEVIGVLDGLTGQNETDRLWALLATLRYSIWKQAHHQDSILFEVKLDTGRGQETAIRLKAVTGPDDECKPCITIMRPEED